MPYFQRRFTLRWRHNERDSVSNHQPHDCLLNRLFTRRSKKTSKLRTIGLCAGNSPETGEFPAQRASNAENVSIWWRHHELNRHWARAVKSSTMVIFEDPKCRVVSLLIEANDDKAWWALYGSVNWVTWTLFSWHELSLIPAWISNHMPCKVWDEITYRFPNFNGATVEVWERISNFIPHFTMGVIIYPCWHWSLEMDKWFQPTFHQACDYLSMLGF